MIEEAEDVDVGLVDGQHDAQLPLARIHQLPQRLTCKQRLGLSNDNCGPRPVRAELKAMRKRHLNND